MRKGKILVLGLVLALSLALIAGCSAPDNNEGYDNGYEVGISETDHIVNTTATDKVILVVSFGTSYNQSRNLTIGGIETAIQNAYPNYQVRRAFTSQIIIDKLAKREGLVIDNVTEAMNRLLLDKVKEVIVQPTTVMNGFEYEDMIKDVMPFADKFDSLKIGKWLLADEADYDEVSELIVKETAKFRADDTALVFMGHGTEHEARATYVKLQAVLTAKGYHDYIIGTVERGIEIDQVREQLSQMDISRVVLRPLMVVAGDHANNDMAGAGEDSWRTILEEDGYMVETVLEGLGQIEGIQDIYIRHLQEAIAGDPVEAVPAATAAGVTAARIQNGSYSIEVDSDTAMFKIVDCQLTVEDEQMMAAITLSGRGYSTLYM
ncbi:MAG TPA: sirohydrochlorin cobaltochelatase, partial [bacterium]|nr:sirohydrochlorin cobaltochelatase [bacterium]